MGLRDCPAQGRLRVGASLLSTTTSQHRVLFPASLCLPACLPSYISLLLVLPATCIRSPLTSGAAAESIRAPACNCTWGCGRTTFRCPARQHVILVAGDNGQHQQRHEWWKCCTEWSRGCCLGPNRHPEQLHDASGQRQHSQPGACRGCAFSAAAKLHRKQ